MSLKLLTEKCLEILNFMGCSTGLLSKCHIVDYMSWLIYIWAQQEKVANIVGLHLKLQFVVSDPSALCHSTILRCFGLIRVNYIKLIYENRLDQPSPMGFD